MTGPDYAARTRRLIARLPSDAAGLACDIANVRWHTGLAGEPHQLYGMAPVWVVIGPTGERRIVAPASELPWIEEQHPLDDVRAVGRFVVSGDPSAQLAARLDDAAPLVAALRSALDAVGANGPLVLDDGARARVATELIQQLKPRSLAVDPAPWRDARAVKDAGEIAALRRVNAVAEAGIARALERADIGVTERDLLRWVRETMLAHGARPMLGSVGIAERGALVDFAPSDRKLGIGDVIRFDVGCILDGYHADLARTAVLGEPQQWIAECHAALVAGEEAALTALAPGVTGEELFRLAVDGVRAAGIDGYDRTHCGHGIGLEMYEPPAVAPHSRRPLAAGMACCLETPLYLIGSAGLQIEDAVVVTEDGYNRLGSLPRKLLEAGSRIPIHG